MEYRMNDKYSSPIEDIFDMCRNSESSNAFLLLVLPRNPETL